MIAASYVTYGQETVFEDEIYDQDVPSSVATKIGEFNSNLLYG